MPAGRHELGDIRWNGTRVRRAGRPAALMAGAALALTMLLPFLWMLGTSLMDEFAASEYPPPLVPADPRFANYPEALTALPFGRFFLNSALFAGGVVAGQLLTSTTMAYAFARLTFPWRDRLFFTTLATIMVPAIVLLIPRFLIINALGWVDTYQGLIATELVSVWGVFLLRQFFLTIPRDLEDAARLDGAGEWTVFCRVVLPLSLPALATLALFAFVEAWKNFLWPLIATRSLEMRVVEVGIAQFHGFYYSNWPYQMAAAVAALAPLVLVFIVAQRYFVRGIQLTGLK